jgi:hypothetical protein
MAPVLATPSTQNDPPSTVDLSWSRRLPMRCVPQSAPHESDTLNGICLFFRYKKTWPVNDCNANTSESTPCLWFCRQDPPSTSRLRRPYRVRQATCQSPPILVRGCPVVQAAFSHPLFRGFSLSFFFLLSDVCLVLQNPTQLVKSIVITSAYQSLFTVCRNTFLIMSVTL